MAHQQSMCVRNAGEASEVRLSLCFKRPENVPKQQTVIILGARKHKKYIEKSPC